MWRKYILLPGLIKKVEVKMMRLMIQILSVAEIVDLKIFVNVYDYNVCIVNKCSYDQTLV